MRVKDLALLCLQNLFRRKSRTFLTVLGVVVGACSIIIMISIGVGMGETQDKLLSEMGDLTIITVSPAGRGRKAAKLNGAAIKSIEGIEGVEAVTPVLSSDLLSVKVYAGRDRRYVASYASVAGMDMQAMETLGYKLVEGAYPGKARGGALAGENLAYNFEDSKRPQGSNTVDLYDAYDDETGELVDPPDPFFDIMRTPLELELSWEGEEKTTTYRLQATGRMKEDYGKGSETGEGLILPLNELRALMDQVRRQAGRGRWDGNYASAQVKAAAIDQVAQVEKEIRRLGFSTNSMESIRQPMEEDARQKQMMMGGMGAISLLVAALGITNTMIMSISERTREIGVMKSLGCFVRDVRRLFLLEAGCIGLMGGVVGIVLSYAISAVMNLVSAQAPIASLEDAMAALSAVGSRTSVIPPWLTGFALVFSVLIGLGSGYYPASRAVRIPALEAIKHD